MSKIRVLPELDAKTAILSCLIESASLEVNAKQEITKTSRTVPSSPIIKNESLEKLVNMSVAQLVAMESDLKSRLTQVKVHNTEMKYLPHLLKQLKGDLEDRSIR